MDMYLNRNFIIVSNLDEYKKTLINKITKSKKSDTYNILELEQLLNYLKLVKSLDIKRYNKLTYALEKYTEEFIALSSKYIVLLLKCEGQQSSENLLSFQNIDDIEALDILNSLYFDFRIILEKYINDIIQENFYQEEQLHEKIFSIIRGENLDFITKIVVEMKEMYPAIEKHVILNEYLQKLVSYIKEYTKRYYFAKIATLKVSAMKEQHQFRQDQYANYLAKQVKRDKNPKKNT